MSILTYRRKSLARPAQPLSGVGVRSGREVTVRLLPAECGRGLVLRRADLDVEFPLNLTHALSLPSCTAIGTGPQDATLFVEHLMAALHALGVSDLVVETTGPELPLLDGSARPWHAAISDAGVRESAEELPPLVVTCELQIADGDKLIAARPAPTAVFSYDLDYAHPLIGQQSVTFSLPGDNFAADLAPARTFALSEELERARQAGMLPGGSEVNCRVVYPDRFSEPPTMPDEFARHKLLDMLGDLYLLGRPIIGHFTGKRTGHAHNRELLRQIATCEYV